MGSASEQSQRARGDGRSAKANLQGRPSEKQGSATGKAKAASSLASKAGEGQVRDQASRTARIAEAERLAATLFRDGDGAGKNGEALGALTQKGTGPVGSGFSASGPAGVDLKLLINRGGGSALPIVDHVRRIVLQQPQLVAAALSRWMRDSET